MSRIWPFRRRSITYFGFFSLGTLGSFGVLLAFLDLLFFFPSASSWSGTCRDNGTLNSPYFTNAQNV